MALNVWSICDRCGFKYYARSMRREATNLYVCENCYDGLYDRKRHPQNRSPTPRYESKKVPDGRPNADINDYVATELGFLLLTENGDAILVETLVWTPSQSVGG